MKRIIVYTAMILALCSGIAFADNITADPENIISNLSYYSEDNTFSGSLYTSLRGTTGGHAEVVIENSRGKKYFKRRQIFLTNIV